MELRIYWSDFSKNELQMIFNYYKERANLKVARKLVLGVTQAVSKLTNQPNIGQKEGLLIDREQEFRYLVYKNFKMIYWINTRENRIEIADIFDTRQNPIKIMRGK
jgi:toxin ParE1/3/4